MKKSRIIIALLILATLVIGICIIVTKCSSDSSNDTESIVAGKSEDNGVSIVGKWSDGDEVYEFTASGKYTCTDEDGDVERGTYTKSGDKAILTDEDGFEATYTYKIKGDKLTLTYHSKRTEGKTQTFVYTRVK